MKSRYSRVIPFVVCFTSFISMRCAQRASQTAERPAGLGYHAMAYDADSKRVILFGGQTGDPETSISAETWAYDPLKNRWQKMEPTASPQATSAQAMAYDRESDRVILHGGGGLYDKDRLEEFVLRQTWAYDFNSNAWTKMSDGPPRIGHRMAYDAESDRIVMFSGGCFRDGRFRDVQETWTYDFNSDAWTEMKPARSPAARHYHGLAYDKDTDRVILWGGFIGKDILDTSVWTYDFNNNEWLEITQENVPDVCWYKTLTYDEVSKGILTYGGGDDGSNETWAYDVRENSWTKLKPEINPGKISRMPMVYVPDAKRMVLFGGQLDSRQYTYSDATWTYDPETNVWTDVTVRQGEYLGQKKPGLIPEVFAPGIVSGEFMEHSPPSFSPDGKEVYWSPDFRDSGRVGASIYVLTQKEGRWTAPRVADFSIPYADYNPVLTSDGKRLFFFSGRTEQGQIDEKASEIWMVDRLGSGWSKPRHVPIENRPGYLMTQFSLTKDGILYFSSQDDEEASWNIYRARFNGTSFVGTEKLRDPINTPGLEIYPFVAPDESYLIFTSRDRPDGQGGMDLYISFRKPDGTWTEPRNMGPEINTSAVEAFASTSPDGRYLFFASSRNGNVDIYWVDAAIIEELSHSD
ncbi:MAG: hypothetical protein OEW18_07605 [Candidatus Aminicenantes bacterium]|nr:hypothetical protein [Candidatus Aminicenantes bacterium]